MKKSIEQWLGWMGIGLSIVFLGGFTLVMNQITVTQFSTLFSTVFPAVFNQMPEEEAFRQFKTLGAWFGFTLLIVILLVVVANSLITYRNYRKAAACILVLAGLICLVGTQYLAFPIAFLFFLAAALCLIRKPKPRKLFSQKECLNE